MNLARRLAPLLVICLATAACAHGGDAVVQYSTIGALLRVERIEPVER